jgi:hypothetical protein
MTVMVLIWSTVHSKNDSLASSEDHEKTCEQKSDEDPWPKMIGTSARAGASPAPKVDLDYSSTGARIYIRKFHAKLAEAGREVIAVDEKMLAKGMNKAELSKGYDGPRWAMFPVWLPLKRVTRDPLGSVDRRSFLRSDYILVKLC